MDHSCCRVWSSSGRAGHRKEISADEESGDDEPAPLAIAQCQGGLVKKLPLVRGVGAVVDRLRGRLGHDPGMGDPM